MQDLTPAIRSIEAAVDDAKDGLPEEIFLLVSRLTPLVNVDLLIQDEDGRTLLTWRDDQFYGPGWHVPGGIIRHMERAADRVAAVAREELGADVECEPLAVHEFFDREATNRAHFVSLLYRCRLKTSLDKARQFDPAVPTNGHWQWHDRCPENLIREQAQYKGYFK